MLCFFFRFMCFTRIERWVFHFRVDAKHRERKTWNGLYYDFAIEELGEKLSIILHELFG
jgi:hypothetical protein